MAASGEVEADIAELRVLLESARRPRVKELLERGIENLEKASTSGSEPPPQGNSTDAVPVSAPTHAAAAPAGPVLLQTDKTQIQRSYSPVASFSWDQDTEKVKIYFFLEGATKEGVEVDMKPRSVDVRMHDVGSQGKHLRWGIPHLYKAVDPERSTVTVKPNRVTLTLRKKEKGHWVDLHHKEDKFKPKLDEHKDPMAGIMDIMKNMYDEGDEDMRRTIAKAWTDTQSGKTKDPLYDPSSLPGF